MKIDGNVKLYGSALLSYAVTVLTATVAYLQGLDGQPVDWLVVASFLLAALTQGGKDVITHKAKSPTDPALKCENENKRQEATAKLAADSGYEFSERSISNLQGVHKDLRRVANRALKRSPYDFVITCGRRTIEQQKVLVDTGRSQTLNSRHLSGHALDFAVIVDGVVSWELEYYKAVADVFKAVGDELGVPVEWGGDWSTLVDGPHIQLPRSVYS